jgi:aspartokinase
LNYISAAPFKVCPSLLFISTGWLNQLEQLLKGIAMMKELTLRTRDYLVSFGECMSTRIFAAYMNKLGKKALQVCEMFSLCLYI